MNDRAIHAQGTNRIGVSIVVGLFLAMIAGAVTASVVSAATTFVVNKTGDAPDINPGNGRCDSSSNFGLQCTLRAAIQEANALSGTDTINFKITTASKTIAPASPLPTITGRVTIDGYSQAGTSANTKANSDNAVLKIVLDGVHAGADASGLDLEGSGSVVRGLVIHGFTANGVLLGGTGNTVRGSFIGTNSAGSASVPNNTGILVKGPNNVIGGTSAAARNVVSGNEGLGIDVSGAGASGNLVQGNFVGIDSTGGAALGNGAGVDIFDAPSNTIGGNVAGARNVISGNNGHGVIFGATGSSDNLSTLRGNLIGTNATGTAAVGNSGSGVVIQANSVTVGGTTAGARNVISGNQQHGVLIFAGGGPIRESNVIQGNYIGTNSTGNAAMGNALAGINVFGGHDTLVGGSVAGAGNVVSANGNDGILLFSSGSANTVEGNKIGTKADGTGLLGNTSNGINIFGVDSNTIGGTGAASNLIAHNELDGISISDSTGNSITGNTVFQNGGQGVDAASGPNTISGNAFISDDEGVRVESTATGIHMVGNQMFNNGGLGINLMGGTEANGGVTANDTDDPDSGANNLQNFPVLTLAHRASNGVTTISGSLNSLHSTTFTVQFFVALADPSGHGEAQIVLGSKSVTTNSGGDVTFSFATAQTAPGQFVTATATNNSTGDTSEFSANIVVVSS